MNISTITSEQAKELLNAQAHIWNHIFGFLNSMVLKCALELGIPDAIQRHGKPLSFTELINSLDIHPSKVPSLHRLMCLLCHSNFFSKKKLVNGEPVFDLTINSQLLLKDHPLSIASFANALLGPTMTDPAGHLSCWFKSDVETPFQIIYGMNFWDYTGLDGEFNQCFNKAMSSDARFVANMIMANNESRAIFEGIESMVDVGGGSGTMAEELIKAYPLLKCVVLDLPHVVDGLKGDDEDKLVFVGGNMFEAIPPTNAILLKSILHDWSDEHCIKILQRCKEAIHNKNQCGKVIIIDIVVENKDDSLKYLNTQYLFDMEMMSLFFGGKERNEEEWKNLFINTGFRDYKIFSMLGARSIIEAYPC